MEQNRPQEASVNVAQVYEFLQSYSSTFDRRLNQRLIKYGLGFLGMIATTIIVVPLYGIAYAFGVDLLGEDRFFAGLDFGNVLGRGHQMTYQYFGYPLDWQDRYRKGIESVTAAQLVEAAKKYIHPDHFSILVVGPSEGRDRPLSDLGEVRTVDITIPEPPAAKQG